MPAAVLFVIDNLEFGGGERGFLQVIEALAGAGRRIAVACHPGGVFEARARAAGAAIVPLDMRRRAAPATIARLRRAIRASGARVVHSQGARADFVTRVALVGVPDVRLVCTVQMPPAGFDVGTVRRRLYAALDRAFAGRVDRFIVVSQVLRRRLADAGVPPARVRVIPNGVEPAPADAGTDALRTAFGAPPARLLGAAGRLVWQKGFEVLIDALPRVLAAVPAAQLLLAGTGPREAALRAAAAARGVSGRVVFLGFRADVLDLLRAVEIAVVPSRREGFPMITLEAMSVGTPVVATAIDGIQEQIESDVDGLLVPPGDATSLADAVVRLFGDAALREKLGAAARRRVETSFTVAGAVAATRRVYAELEAAAG